MGTAFKPTETPGAKPTETAGADRRNIFQKLLHLSQPERSATQERGPAKAQSLLDQHERQPKDAAPGRIVKVAANPLTGYKEARVYSIKPNGEPVREAVAKSSAFGLYQRVTDEVGSDGGPKRDEKRFLGIPPLTKNHRITDTPDTRMAREVTKSYTVSLDLNPFHGNKNVVPLKGSAPEHTEPQRTKENGGMSAEQKISAYYRLARSKYSASEWKELSPKAKEWDAIVSKLKPEQVAEFRKAVQERNAKN